MFFFPAAHLPIPTGDAQKVESMRKEEKVATKLEIGSPHPALNESEVFLKHDLVGSQSEAS